MPTEAPTLRIDADAPQPAILANAAEVLRRGGLVAFPTETVYGLGAHALDAGAVARIFRVKGRPATNPLIVHLRSAEDASGMAREWPETARRLAEAFWPGPLTLILPARPTVPTIVTAGLPTVALRVPSHPVARALLQAAALPIAAPSANRSGGISPTTANHVQRGLGAAVDLILDGGATPVGIESTVLDLSGAHPTVLRPGTITIAGIEAVIGPVRTASDLSPDETARSPGTDGRHYAPRAAVRLFTGGAEGGRSEAIRQANDAARRGQRVGWMVHSAVEPPDRGMPFTRLPDDQGGYAQGLYAALHELDAAGCDLLLVEDVPDSPGWAGVRDRLRRAAHD